MDLNNIASQGSQLSQLRQLQQVSKQQQGLTEILQQLAPLVQKGTADAGELLSSLMPQILELSDYAGLANTGVKSFVDGSKLAWADALSDALPAGQKSAILDQIEGLGGTSKALGWAGAGFSALSILGAEDKTEALFETAGSAAGAAVGKSVGATAGASLMVAMGVTAPLAPVGALVGGAIGSMVGSEIGEFAGEELGEFVSDKIPEIEEGLDSAGDAVSDAWESVGDLF